MVKQTAGRDQLGDFASKSQGLVDSSFQYHLMRAKNNGITKAEIAEILTHAAFYAGGYLITAVLLTNGWTGSGSTSWSGASTAAEAATP